MSEHCCSLSVGEKVPDFELEMFDPVKCDFGKFSLKKLKAAKKWTVLFFYPADFTFVWATEFAALAERYDEFQKLGAEVVTVSRDTKFVHLAWQRDEKALAQVRYPMASDVTGDIARLFGVLDEEEGLALRGTFIISPEGTLLNAEVNYFNLGRNVEELLRKVRANKHLAAHPSEGVPAQWKKQGDITLKPGPKLVGRVADAMKKK